MSMRDYFNKLIGHMRRLGRRQFVRNFSGVAIANLISTVISLSIALFIPKLLPIADYSYWQLYVFYVSYVGIMQLGVSDGIYLRYGGRDYEKLDKELIRSQFWLVCLFQIFMAVIVVILANCYISDTDKQLIAVLVGVNLVLVNARSFLQLLLQTTNKMLFYSKNLIYERIVYVALVAIVLLAGSRDFRYLLYADILAKSVMLVLLCFVCRHIVIGKVRIAREYFMELWSNLTSGVKLMIANVTGMLVVGVARFIIEHKWGVTAFGEVALVLSVANLVLIFITAAGVVTYPILKRTKSEKLASVYSDLRLVIVLAMLLFLVLYFPLRYLLDAWLPQYSDALDYLSLVFPMAFYEAKTQILTNTYLKAYRKEGKLLVVNSCSLLVAATLAYVSAFQFNSIELTILSIVLSLAIRSAMSEMLLGKILKISLVKENLLELSMVILFIGATVFWPQYALAVYGLTTLSYAVAKKSDIVAALKRTVLS